MVLVPPIATEPTPALPLLEEPPPELPPLLPPLEPPELPLPEEPDDPPEPEEDDPPVGTMLCPGIFWHEAKSIRPDKAKRHKVLKEQCICIFFFMIFIAAEHQKYPQHVSSRK